jgi:site-specific DNA-cytosine methylase
MGEPRVMRHLSLFTGSGIGDLAAKAAGIETVAQCENEPSCCYCLRKLWPECHLFTDVRDVSATELDRLGLLPVDLISGGFPCADISTAGKGAGIHGKQSGLWFEMRRVIGEVRSRWVLAENVPALRVRGGDRVCADLEELGYFWRAYVVGADDVGAPHRRKRVWIVGRLEHAEYNGFLESKIAAGIRSRSDIGETRKIATQQPARPVDGRRGSEGMAAFRWPARPGQPQHDWEDPRLTQSRLGFPTDGMAERLLREAFGIDARVRDATLDRVALCCEEIASARRNKSGLRAAGNAWVYPLAEILFRMIVEMDASMCG